jgi:hypothetical protein
MSLPRIIYSWTPRCFSRKSHCSYRPVMLLASIREVSSSKLDRDNDCSERILVFLPASLAEFGGIILGNGWFQWPHGLRRGSAATRLLGFRVRIPLGAWRSVSCVSVVCRQVEVFASGLSLVQRIVVCLSVIAKRRQLWASGPLLAVVPWKKNRWWPLCCVFFKINYLLITLQFDAASCTL